jgi:hypothetical protein
LSLPQSRSARENIPCANRKTASTKGAADEAVPPPLQLERPWYFLEVNGFAHIKISRYEVFPIGNEPAMATQTTVQHDWPVSDANNTQVTSFIYKLQYLLLALVELLEYCS